MSMSAAPSPHAPARADAFGDVPSVFIEITSRCNMDCTFCPYSVLQRPKQDMKHEYVLEILEELKWGGKTSVTFHVLGEPMLNRHLFEYCELCDRYNIRYWLVSNALLLSPEINDRLFSLKNLSHCEISLHTVSDASIKLRNCKKLDFATYLDTIKTAVFHEKRLQSAIGIHLDVMYDLHLHHEHLWQAFNTRDWLRFVDTMSAWAEELNTLYPEARSRFPKYYLGKKRTFQHGDHVTYRDRGDIPEDPFKGRPELNWIHWEFFPNVFLTLKRFFLFTKSQDYLKQAFAGKAVEVTPAADVPHCPLGDSLAVLSNGEITFCCLDYEGELSCGNIARMRLADAARSAKRAVLMASPGAFAACRLCKGEVRVVRPVAGRDW